MMMDPYAWDKCMDHVSYLKQSKRKWTIRYVELQGDNINYTAEQLSVIAKHRARRANIFWFWKNNKHYLSKVKVVDDKGKTHKFSDNEILLRKLNAFSGWSCNVGVDWVHIARSGEISGTCGQLLYGLEKNYNFYSDTFKTDFAPNIVPAICNKVACLCNIETVMKKQKINTKKIIPIYEH
jgi:NADH pyrophosphatase NudC (nudix superfamily)